MTQLILYFRENAGIASLLAGIIKTIRISKKRKININALLSGSRLMEVSRLRTSLAIQLVNDLGLSLAEYKDISSVMLDICQ